MHKDTAEQTWRLNVMLAFAEKKEKKKKKHPREHTYYWCSGHSTVIILALRFPVKLCTFILRMFAANEKVFKFFF